MQEKNERWKNVKLKKKKKDRKTVCERYMYHERVFPIFPSFFRIFSVLYTMHAHIP